MPLGGSIDVRSPDGSASCRAAAGWRSRYLQLRLIQEGGSSFHSFGGIMDKLILGSVRNMSRSASVQK